MYRNYKPHVAVVALLILAIIFTGCAVETDAATAEKTVERFTVEYAGNNCSVITDNETGVQSLAYRESTNYGKGIGLTKLEGANGN